MLRKEVIEFTFIQNQIMKRTPWFERKFDPIADNGLLPGIIERLEGTPARLKAKVGGQNAL